MYTTDVKPQAPTAASQLKGWLGRGPVLLLIGSAAILAGGFYSWDWLVALGVAPLLVGVLPCVAMCALGLCMNRAGGQTCDVRSPDQGGADATRRSPSNSPAAGNSLR